MNSPKKPDAIGAGANSGRPEGESTDRRIQIQFMPLVAEPAAPPTDAFLDELFRTGVKLEITGPDAIPLPPLVFQELGEQEIPTDAELMARTHMSGIYESQIRARIERAWLPPTQTSPRGLLRCRVLIRQKPDGRISEVELPHGGCDGPDNWRQSVVNAVFAASPLPAPPHPGVFVESLSLELRSDKFTWR